MALQYPGYSVPQPTTTKLTDVVDGFDQSFQKGRERRQEADAPAVFEKSLPPLQEFGLPEPGTLREMFANPNTRAMAIDQVRAAQARRDEANDPMRKLQLEKVQLDIAAARRGPSGPGPTSEMRNFQFAQQNPGFAEFIGKAGAEKAPADVQEYLWYRKNETEAGRDPMPYIDFRTALKGGGGGGATDDITEYNFAKQNGYAGTFEEWLSQGGKSGGGKYGLTPIWGVDAQGNPVLGQMNEGGGVQVAPMPEGVTFGKEPIRMDAGTHFVLLDPVTRQQIGMVPKDNYGEGFEKAKGGAEGKYAGEAPERQIKAKGALSTLETKHKVVSNAIDKALNNAGNWTTGIVGQIASAVPGSPAYDLARTLDTIKANIGFNELQTMRDNSPTGGALGAITERELAFLQSTVASIEQAQSETQLRENLSILRDFLSSNAQQRRSAYEQQFGSGQQPAAAPSGSVDDLVNKYLTGQ